METRVESILERLPRTLGLLELQFSDAREAVATHAKRQQGKAWRDFRHDHLPFLLAYPVIVGVSPYIWIRWHLGNGFPSVRALALPPVLILAILLLAVFYDKLIEYRNGPSRFSEGQKLRNVSLFLSLPVSASTIFFLIHPAAGWIMLVASIARSLFQCARYQASVRDSSMRGIFAEMIVAAGFLLLPAVGLLILYNLALTARILIDLF